MKNAWNAATPSCQSPAEATVRDAQPEDALAIVNAVRSGFSRQHLSRLIYGCAGITQYVAQELSAPAAGRQTWHFVAESGAEGVVGHAAFGLAGSGLFLNYISVLPGWQGSGLGRSLLGFAIPRLAHEASTLHLDVLQENWLALNWYRRLGFSLAGTSDWWEMRRPFPMAARFRLPNWPQAEACQAAFGFSMLTVTTDRGEYSVGRLGSTWIRVTSADALEDPGFWAAVEAVQAGRGVLAILDEPLSNRQRAISRLLTCTLRLSIPLDQLRRRVSGAGGRVRP